MTRRCRNEDGWAVVTVMSVMSIVLLLGIMALTAVDALQRSTGRERVRESAFTVAEAVLHSEVRALTTRWPSRAATALPVLCTPTVAPAGCAQPASLAEFFAANPTAAGAGWSVSVRDNLGSAAGYYSRAVLDGTPCPDGVAPCTWDANRDGQLWVRAEAIAHGQRRVVVALAKQHLVRVPLPRKVLVAGTFATTNNGLKTIVDTRGCLTSAGPSGSCNTAQPGPVAVRCTTSSPQRGDPCLSFRRGQVSPEVLETYPDNVLSPRALDLVRARAIQLGTYYTSCPSAAQLAGELVFIEGASCSYTTGLVNSPAAPGVLVVAQGTLTLGGNIQFFGAIIAANALPAPADSGAIVTLTGTSYVQGAIFVEGHGSLVAGSSGLNVSFDARALGQLMGADATTVAPGSFREVPPSA